MSKISRFLASLAIAAGIGFALTSAGAAQNLADFALPSGMPRLSIVTPAGNFAHMVPTIAHRAKISAPSAIAPTGNLTYHGGPIMPSVEIYSIFWLPPTLQDSTNTVMGFWYQVAAYTLAVDYPGHGIQNNSTQYYENIGGKVTFISNSGGSGGYYTDTTSPYPTGHCTYTGTWNAVIIAAGNCFTDADIQAEISHVMAINGWTGGINKMFLVYTAKGEGSCLPGPTCVTSGSHCNAAYACYCAYHSSFLVGSVPIIYGNETYGEPSDCSAAPTSPKGDPAADTLMSYTTHEITEAMTDPFGNAWWDSTTPGGFGAEIGDICNTYDTYMYGATTWPKFGDTTPVGNQRWNRRVYEVQTQWDQHTGACVQVGP